MLKCMLKLHLMVNVNYWFLVIFVFLQMLYTWGLCTPLTFHHSKREVSHIVAARWRGGCGACVHRISERLLLICARQYHYIIWQSDPVDPTAAAQPVRFLVSNSTMCRAHLAKEIKIVKKYDFPCVLRFCKF